MTNCTCDCHKTRPLINASSPYSLSDLMGISRPLDGPLPKGLQSQVDEWKKATTATLLDYYARNGIKDRKTIRQAKAEITRRATDLQRQLAAQLYGAGQSAMYGQPSRLSDIVMAGADEGRRASEKAMGWVAKYFTAKPWE